MCLPKSSFTPLFLPLFLACVCPAATGFLHWCVHQMENWSFLLPSNVSFWLCCVQFLTHNRRLDNFVLVSIQVFHLTVHDWLWRSTDITRGLSKGWIFLCENTLCPFLGLEQRVLLPWETPRKQRETSVLKLQEQLFGVMNSQNHLGWKICPRSLSAALPQHCHIHH